MPIGPSYRKDALLFENTYPRLLAKAFWANENGD